MFIDRLAVIGVGLIGGSLALALKQRKLVGHVVGYGRNEANLKQAVALGVIDEYSLDLPEVVKDADVIFLATPLGVMEKMFRDMQTAIKDTAVITDGGSAKQSVVVAARNGLDKHFARFVPSHPIAGKEKSGVEAADAELYVAHRVIVTPVEETDSEALEVITELWQAVGAEVMQMGVEHHDKVLAATSHLPHMLAYALVDSLASLQEREEIFEYAAGGFADFSRIASSSPEMWHDICFSNKEQLLTMLNHFDEHIDKIRHAIMEDNSENLLDVFKRAKQARDNFTEIRNKQLRR